MRRALVTGSAGWLGGHIVQKLKRTGAETFGIGLGQAWCDHHYIESLVTESALRQCPFEPQVIFHCAGGSSVAQSIADPIHDYEMSVKSVEILVAALKSLKWRSQIVFTSSAAVYGAASGGSLLTESSPLEPVSPYGSHKVVCEQVLAELSKQGQNAVRIARLFSVYGPGLRKQLLWDALRKFEVKNFGFFGTGLEERDWIYLDDAVDALLLLGSLSAPPFLVANVATGSGTRNGQILRMLRNEFDGGTELNFSGVSRQGDPERLVGEARVMASLGWAPKIDLVAGLGEVVRWYRTIQK